MSEIEDKIMNMLDEKDSMVEKQLEGEKPFDLKKHLFLDDPGTRKKIAENVDMELIEKAATVGLESSSFNMFDRREFKKLGITEQDAKMIWQGYSADKNRQEYQAKLDEMSFNEAFQHSRSKVIQWGAPTGDRPTQPGDTFMWRGKEFKVTTGEEEKYIKGGKDYSQISKRGSKAKPSYYTEEAAFFKEANTGRPYASPEEIASDRFNFTDVEDQDPDLESLRDRLRSQEGKTFKLGSGRTPGN